MDCNTLAGFRRTLYGCFRRAGDALMNLVEALLSETPAQSLVELSLSPFSTRQGPRLYAAFQAAPIDRDALQKRFAPHAPPPAPGHRLVLGAEASSILRVHSKTGAERTSVHASNLPEGVTPVRPGGQFSPRAVLAETNSRWTSSLDNGRVARTGTQASVRAEQWGPIVGLLPARPLWLGEGYYGRHTFLALGAALPCDVLVRFAKNRVLSREPSPSRLVEGLPPGRGSALPALLRRAGGALCRPCSEHARHSRRPRGGKGRPRPHNRSGLRASSALAASASRPAELAARHASRRDRHQARSERELACVAGACVAAACHGTRPLRPPRPSRTGVSGR